MWICATPLPSDTIQHSGEGGVAILYWHAYTGSAAQTATTGAALAGTEKPARPAVAPGTERRAHAGGQSPAAVVVLAPVLGACLWGALLFVAYAAI